MKPHRILLACIFTVLLAACTPAVSFPTGTTTVPETTEATTLPPETTIPTTTVPETTVPETTAGISIGGLSVDTVIEYFNEVCLGAEYSERDDTVLVQKWVDPIYYFVEGTPTEEDLTVIGSLAAQLNTIPGFPGLYEAALPEQAYLTVYFCGPEELQGRMEFSTNEEMDGAVRFWYDEENRITSGIICCRNDIAQDLRNSVIMEEFYNGLGPAQDTVLRSDSIIYQYGSVVQSLSEVDLLLLELLYHPAIQCGMNAQECEAVIRALCS